MQALCFILASILLGFAWLSPFHTYPWVTFSSDLAGFAAAIVLFTLALNQNIKIPRAQLWMLPIMSIPLIQWSFGLIGELSIALLSTFYLFTFWLMIVLGFNLSLQQPHRREQLMQGFSYLVLVTAVLTSLMAILQWLKLESYFSLVNQLKGNRPFANFGQPNNMATFLIVGLFGALYLYEKQKAALWLLVPSSLLILFAISLGQSRTSWIVLIFTFVYWIYKQYRHNPRLNFPKLVLWCAVFVLLSSYLLPWLTQWISAEQLSSSVTQTASIVDRAGRGHERLGMWMQIVHAIAEQPWWGYGWNQTSIAVVESLEFNTVQVWFNSSHNILLDVLVWNGIPLGLLIIGYVGLWLLWLNLQSKETVSIVAMLMVAAILIHAMLEFPQRYAYFLLPMGFLLGLIQSQTPNLKGIEVHKNIVRCVWVIAIVVMLLIWRDYKLYQENSRLVFANKQPTVSILGSSEIILLTQFKWRLNWIGLSPNTEMSDAELQQLAKIVKNRATPYNLKKYAQLLAYNGKETEAKQYIAVWNRLYRKQFTFEQVVGPPKS
ncbi:PglL family O-oligosaccharyltransferase [Acinetobacter haemolyticus]|uniref:PglL family O-oligosaccharyltransferase n=1 Tax=Acinetobacter haemolyticus TaxID=29430 RepID=UPI0021CDCAA2|nr:O-antigen ligase family protein [Acinetobacter haemolyticus]MCU4378579.1 O-antigen ligase C-terminal domain-containing protein [Acinetobacter haemolyticus]